LTKKLNGNHKRFPFIFKPIFHFLSYRSAPAFVLFTHDELTPKLPSDNATKEAHPVLQALTLERVAILLFKPAALPVLVLSVVSVMSISVSAPFSSPLVNLFLSPQAIVPPACGDSPFLAVLSPEMVLVQLNTKSQK
jgi:hypothetical protein